MLYIIIDYDLFANETRVSGIEVKFFFYRTACQENSRDGRAWGCAQNFFFNKTTLHAKQGQED